MEVVHFNWRYSLASTFIFLVVLCLETALSATRDYIVVQLSFKLAADVLLLGLVFFMKPCSVGVVNHMLISIWGINLLSTIAAWVAFFLDDAANIVPNVVFVVGTVVWVLARSLHLLFLLRWESQKEGEEGAAHTNIASGP